MGHAPGRMLAHSKTSSTGLYRMLLLYAQPDSIQAGWTSSPREVYPT